MNIELNTAGTAPLEVLDTHVSIKNGLECSHLSVEFLCRDELQDNHLQLPPLTWFDAQQLQRFTAELAGVKSVETCQTELPDAGVRLTGMVQQSDVVTGREIHVEPLPGNRQSFVPFTISGTQNEIRSYARKLYNRLWEVFCRG